jgi:hypothetical protein
MNHELELSYGFFLAVLSAVGLGFFATSVIPHLGHLPGLSSNTSGCMGQVYFTAVVVLFGGVLSLPVWAKEVLAAVTTNRRMSNFFILN